MDETLKNEYVRTAYQTALEDIRFFKRQQWVVTNYAILLFGAVFVFSATVKLDLLFPIPVLIGAASIFLIYLLEASLEDVRKRLVETRKQIPKELESAFFVDPTCGLESNLHKYGVFILLIIVLVVGVILCTLGILKNLGRLSLCFQSYLSKPTINSFGLILDITGVLLLLFYWIPAQVAFEGMLATIKDELPKECRKKLKRNSILATLGLIFIVLGFMLQLVSNYV